MPDEAEEKTETATPRKKQQEREEGKAPPLSTELYSAATLLGGTFLISSLGPRMLEQLMALTRACLTQSVPVILSLQGLSALFLQIAVSFFKIALPFLLSLLFVGLVTKLAQTGLIFTLKPLVPNFSSFNLSAGVKQIFSTKTLVQLVFNILKLVIIAKFLYSGIIDLLPQAMLLSFMEPFEIVGFAASLVLGLAFKIGLFLAVIAFVDYAYQRWEHEKSSRMSKQEVKDELKTQEGDPRVKARMRSIQMQAARQRMFRDVPQADVVITNPVHYAVVIKYDVVSHAAPTVVAKGARLLAERIKKIARENNVPIVENPYLARALFKSVAVGDQIPEKFYQAIAEILSYVYQVNKDKLRTVTQQLAGAAA